MMGRAVDFSKINAAALPALPALCARWMPGGKRVGREYVTLNPTRADRRAGSFKVNLQTGRWGDFATGDKGGDAVSLAVLDRIAGNGVRVILVESPDRFARDLSVQITGHDYLRSLGVELVPT